MSTLSKYSFWVALVVFVLVILLGYKSLFKNDLNNNRSMVGKGWSMEYDWSVDVAKGTPLYPSTETTFIEGKTLAYMPLYFLLVGSLMKVFGLYAVVGKVVSALCVLGTALLVYKVGVKLSSRKLLPIIPGVILLLFPTLSNYVSEQMKIDILGLSLTTVGLYLVMNKKYLWSVPFVVLALFTKQYFVVLPAAVGIYLLLRDRETLVKYAVLYVVLVGLGFGVGQLLTGGTFFRHTVLFMFDPQFGSIVWSRILAGSLVCLGYLAPVLILAGFSIWRTRVFGLLGIYLVVSLLVMLYTVGKVGSGTNYAYDTLVAGCCLSSLVLGRSKEYAKG